MKIDIRTLNETFEAFAENHPMINSFNNSEFETIFSNDRKYPVMWVGYPSFDFRQNAIDQNVNIMFLNNVVPGENYVLTYSDMLLIAEDFHSKFASNIEGFEFSIDTNVSGYPITTEISGDEVAGVAMTAKVKIHMPRNETIIPV